MTNPLGIIDGIVTNLSSASVLGSPVGKNYSVLETTQGTAAVVSLTGARAARSTMMDVEHESIWTATIQLYTKDTGNASATLDRNMQDTGKVWRSLFSDDTIQGTVDQIDQIRLIRDPQELFVLNSGLAFLPSEIQIDVLEFYSNG